MRKDADATNEYLFPLAARGSETINGETVAESFFYGTYLKAGVGNMDIDAIWWLRSGTATAINSRYAYGVSHDGSVVKDRYVDGTYGVRPAFVLKI